MFNQIAGSDPVFRSYHGIPGLLKHLDEQNSNRGVVVGHWNPLPGLGVAC